METNKKKEATRNPTTTSILIRSSQNELMRRGRFVFCSMVSNAPAANSVSMSSCQLTPRQYVRYSSYR